MKRLCFAFFVIPFLFSSLYAGQSTITEAEGYACMGYDKSRKQTEDEALANAKRMAVEYASTYLRSETQVKNAMLEKDLVDAYAHASVKVIQEISRGWYKDSTSGDCFKIKVKAEVIPDEAAMARISGDQGAAEDPSRPLHVQIWADKKEYRQKEKMKIYIRGNKPFHARVLYRDVQGHVLQLLPNPYRAENYFAGGAVYEIPSGNDRFELEVTPPFGEENITIFASSSPLGDLNLKEAEGVYQVQTGPGDIGVRTRSIQVKERPHGKDGAAAEFYESTLALKTFK